VALIDTSSVTYPLSNGAQMDLLSLSLSAGDFESAHSCIPDCSENGPPPLLHLHQLHSTRLPNTSITLSDAGTLQDVCRNYHELSMLARA